MLKCCVNLGSQIDARLSRIIRKILHNYYHNVQLCDSLEYNMELFAFNKMEVRIVFEI